MNQHHWRPNSQQGLQYSTQYDGLPSSFSPHQPSHDYGGPSGGQPGSFGARRQVFSGGIDHQNHQSPRSPSFVPQATQWSSFDGQSAYHRPTSFSVADYRYGLVHHEPVPSDDVAALPRALQSSPGSYLDDLDLQAHVRGMEIQDGPPQGIDEANAVRNRNSDGDRLLQKGVYSEHS